MATAPNYAATPRCGLAVISTANTNRDGTGTIATVLSAGGSGSRIEEVVVTATGTTTAGMVRLYINDGSNHRLLCELPITAVTPSGTVRAASARAAFDNLVIPNGYALTASTHNAESFVVAAFGGDF